MSESLFFEQQDGSRIAYKVYEPCKSDVTKDETPLVMIVGLWTPKELLMGLEKELAKNRKVIVLDNRGIGESTVASENDPCSIDLMAQDTIALIKHLAIKKFNLLGWSMGGQIALCIALNIPPQLKLEKLIICASWLHLTTATRLDNVYNLPKWYYAKSLQEQRREITIMFEKNFTDYLLKHPEMFDKVVEVMFNARRPFEIFKRQWEAIKQSSFASKVHMIKVPTLIIHGEVDKLVSIQEGELLAHEIPDTIFVRIPKVGHMFWPMEPKSVIIINDFLFGKNNADVRNTARCLL
ncbi:3380_t:CDS:2 [Paraglomus brasilianum]|uniref:3380_t:CDS:1 n=1 Tax=Paraglomus brasilianum TaxID=144538 RepID=A0A9N9BBW2_9GLOM|nr:3380_t:CDS:2 [Paraglomus brasilianum]